VGCKACARPGGHGGTEGLRLAAAAVEAAGDLTFWRAQTPVELEFGDIPRVAADFNAAELAIAEAVRDPLKAVVRALATDALAAVKKGDTVAIAALTADPADLTAALKGAIGSAIDAGKVQVFDQWRKQTGRKLAKPPRVRPKLAAKFLAGKAVTQAEHLVNEARAAAQKMALSELGRGAYDADTLEAFVTLKAESLLVAMAREDAREAVGIGRLLAQEDTKGDIESVVYTAILDSNVCDVCESRDGDEYGPADMGQAPNPDCEGALYAGCRCAEIILYRKG
jgi:hypothetical protein